MRTESSYIWGLILLLPLLLLGASIVGCSRHEGERMADGGVAVRTDTGVRLTDEAMSRMGIEVSPVTSTDVDATICAVGWFSLPPGAEVTIAAAATGFVEPENVGLIRVGATVTSQQQLGTLQVFLSPQEEAQLVGLKEQADILIRQSQASLEAAEARLKRVQQLDHRGALSGKEVEQAQEAMQRAKAAYEESQEQLPFLPTEPYQRPLQLNGVAITAPQGGQVTQVLVRTGQLVMAGAPLWTITDWSLLWLKVPVFEGELMRVDLSAVAEVSVKGVAKTLSAKPINVPQPVVERSRSVDLLYVVENADHRLRPGQAASVLLPTGASVRQAVVPRSAVIWDGWGNASVYVEEGRNQFRRQPIRLGVVRDDSYVVLDGLVDGQRVVSVGAEVLSGEEFRGQMELPSDGD